LVLIIRIYHDAPSCECPKSGLKCCSVKDPNYRYRYSRLKPWAAWTQSDFKNSHKIQTTYSEHHGGRLARTYGTDFLLQQCYILYRLCLLFQLSPGVMDTRHHIQWYGRWTQRHCHSLYLIFISNAFVKLTIISNSVELAILNMDTYIVPSVSFLSVLLLTRSSFLLSLSLSLLFFYNLFILDFQLLPCSECCMLSSGWFPGVWMLYADVSEHFHLHRRVVMKMEQSVPKRWHIKFRRREVTQKKAYNLFTVGTK
jgi:hypothetical protein